MLIPAPPSKSYAIRAVAAAMLAGGWRVFGAGDSQDVAAAMRAAEALRAGAATLDVGESALAARLFMPIAALGDRPVTITGRGTLLGRPMDVIINSLRGLGVSVTSSGGRLPVTVYGGLRGGEVTIDGSAGSQAVTGLLMALPLATGDSVLKVENPVSRPYIDMTLSVLAHFGVEVERGASMQYFIRGGQRYVPRDYAVEGDWSAASCLLVAGAMCGEVAVGNLNLQSLQADIAILDALTIAGAEVVKHADSVIVSTPDFMRNFKFDATDCPDLCPAVVALAAACEGVSVIRGVRRLRDKESDRARALAEEFGRLGIAVAVDGDEMRVRGGVPCGATVSSRGDHRIAMSLAVSALRADGEVVIEGREAVAKSYPAFWRDLELIKRRG
jgi:3-phosphoshikimate 1-carboxyvinyltransferase